MLVVKDLVTCHGRIRVLHEICFEIGQGEITAVIGPNGAGKSTLMGTLTGIYRAGSGSCQFQGQEITSLTPQRIVRLGISLVPERRQVFDSLTVEENLLLGAYHRYKRDKAVVAQDLERVLTIFPKLAEMLERKAGTLSGGEQQMLVIGRGLMSKPELLLLDEPSLGLAPMIVQDIFNTLRQLRDEAGTTILLVEQNARAAMKISDKVLVIERGQVKMSGTPGELRHDESIQAAYLGKGYFRAGKNKLKPSDGYRAAAGSGV